MRTLYWRNLLRRNVYPENTERDLLHYTHYLLTAGAIYEQLNTLIFYRIIGIKTCLVEREISYILSGQSFYCNFYSRCTAAHVSLVILRSAKPI